MRLFEVDQGSARDVLAVFQGLANKNNTPAVLPMPTVMNILKPFVLGIATPDGLIALKNAIDPQGDVIKDISDNGTLTLKTNAQDPNTPDQSSDEKPTGPSVDQMASHNSKNLEPKL
jgi:hypothetical protein